MARKSAEEVEEVRSDPYAAWLAQEPCAECGGRPGLNPATGVEMKYGHRLGCPFWQEEA